MTGNCHVRFCSGGGSGDALAYRNRIILAYGLLILAFGGAYWELDRHAQHPLNFGQALIVSITAFHGRVFSYNPFTLSDPQIVVTAIEAICGLVIEGLFVAMLVQRFFNR